MDPKTQVDPLKIVAKLREKLSSSQLQESVLLALLDDSNNLIMQLRGELAEAETARDEAEARVTSITAENKELAEENVELDEENKRLRTTLSDKGRD